MRSQFFAEPFKSGISDKAFKTSELDCQSDVAFATMRQNRVLAATSSIGRIAAVLPQDRRCPIFGAWKPVDSALARCERIPRQSRHNKDVRFEADLEPAMKRFALLLATTAFATPAIAADVVYEEPPAPMAMMAAPTWTGFYVGVQGGAAFNPEDPDGLGISSTFGTGASVPGLTVGTTLNSTLDAAFASGFSSSFDESFAGGAHVGYDYQIDQFVLGGVLDINALDISQTQTAVSNTPAFYSAERSLDYIATARLRAGYAVTPTALAYVTGGLAYGEVDYSFSTDSPAVTGNARSTATARAAQVFEDEDDFGYTVGGGMEVMVTDNVSFGAEYLYTNLGGSSFTRLDGGPFDGTAANGGGTTGGSTDFSSNDDFDFHTVTAKISYRFK